VVTPKGTLIAVAPGRKCPANMAPQSLSSTPAREPVVGRSNLMKVGASKTELTSVTFPAGPNLVSATVDIVQKLDSGFDQTIKCVFTDAAGKTIANSESATTIPAGSAGMRTTVP
jgi:hypothetical protein